MLLTAPAPSLSTQHSLRPSQLPSSGAVMLDPLRDKLSISQPSTSQLTGLAAPERERLFQRLVHLDQHPLCRLDFILGLRFSCHLLSLGLQAHPLRAHLDRILQAPPSLALSLSTCDAWKLVQHAKRPRSSLPSDARQLVRLSCPTNCLPLLSGMSKLRSCLVLPACAFAVRCAVLR